MRRANIVNVAGRRRIWRLLAMAVLIVSALALSGGDSRAQEPPADNITVTDTSISFSWTEHGSVVFYWHQYPNGRVKLFNDQAVQFSGKSFTISGLTPATTYRLYFYQTFYGELIVDTLPHGITTTSEITISGGTTITEGGNATFTLTASPAPAASLDVNVSPLQSGDWGISTAKQTVTIPTTGSATLTLATTNDAIDEADGSVTATIISGTGYTASTSNGSATVQVSDDDVPELSIAAGPAVPEANDATFTVSASPAPHAPLSVSVTITASGGFASPGAQTITIPTSGTTTLTVATIGDKLDEPDGSVTATLAAGTGYTLASSSTATVIVTDDDDPEVSITAGGDITEGGSASFSLSITPTQTITTDVTVTVSQSGDFASVGQQTVTIPASGTASFSVATTDDSADEPDGSVTATIDPGAGYVVSTSAGAATVNIADDDDPPQSQEESQTCTPTLPSNAVTVTEVTGWRDAHSQNADHVLRWNKVLVALGEDVGDSTIKATTVSEAQANKDKYIGDRWIRVTATLQALAQCASSDTTADPEISVTGGSDVTEGGNVIFTFTATPAPSSSVDVNIEVTQSGDYTSQTGAQTVTISDTGTASLVIGTTDDATDESDGSVTATISTGTGYTVSSTAGTATVNVADDDVTQQQTNSEPTITIGDASADEGDTITFTVSVSPTHTAAITLDYETKDGSAISHPDVNDYTAASGTVTIPANSGSATITVTTIEDTDIEIDDEFTLVLSGTLPTGVVMGNDTATGTITNDDTGSVGRTRVWSDGKHHYDFTIAGPYLLKEGAPTTRTIQIKEQPPHTLTVYLVAKPASDSPPGSGRGITYEPNYLVFTPANWNTPQNIAISGEHDFNTHRETGTFTLFSVEHPGAQFFMFADQDRFEIVDDMKKPIQQNKPNPNVLNEADANSSLTYRLRLGAVPYEDIDVTIDNPDPGAVQVTPTSFTFDDTNWDQFQEVTITPVADGDSDDESVEITVTIPVPGAKKASPRVARFTVEVKDTPALAQKDTVTPAVLVSTDILLINELGRKPYEVWLATDPGAGKSVTVTPTFTGPDVLVKPASLTFTGGTNGNWATKQQVTVSTAFDFRKDHHRVTISHAISGDSDDYDGNTPADSIDIGIIDNHAIVNIEFDRSHNLVLAEGDTTGVPIRVRLTNDPNPHKVGNNDIVLQTHPEGTDLVASPTTLTFTGGASGNWKDWQTLTIVPATGKADDGNTTHDEHWIKVSLGMAPHQIINLPGYPSTEFDVVTRTIDIFYFDDELAEDIILEHTTIDLNEDDGPSKYTISLGADPGGPVTVNITNPDPTKLSISPETVTFTYGGTGDWHTKEITITPLGDRDEDDEDLQVVHTYNYAGVSGKTQSMQVRITDSGVPVGLVYSKAEIYIDESLNGDVSVLSAEHLEIIKRNGFPPGYGFSIYDRAVQQCMKLDGDPLVDVTITFWPKGTWLSDGTGSGDKTLVQVYLDEPRGKAFDNRKKPVVASWTFTPGTNGNWNDDVCFAVLADYDGEQSHVDAHIKPTVTSTATIVVPTFRVRVLDNYWDRIDIYPLNNGKGPDIEVTEGGATAKYRMVHSFASNTLGTVKIIVPDEYKDTIRVSKTVLRSYSDWKTLARCSKYRPNYYSTCADITIRALPDANLVDEVITINHEVTGLAGGVTTTTPGTITVRVTDVESKQIDLEVGPGSLFLVEETVSDNIWIRLKQDPIVSVTVTAAVTTGDGKKVRILPDKLTFDSSNYNTFQRFSVEALSDTDKSNDKVTVTISATGAGLIIPDVTIDADIIDDD